MSYFSVYVHQETIISNNKAKSSENSKKATQKWS